MHKQLTAQILGTECWRGEGLEMNVPKIYNLKVD